MSLFHYFNIAEKTIVISGATGYFGRTMTEAFDQLGAKVIALARSNRIHDLIESRNLKNTTPVIVDLYDREALTVSLKTICERHDRIDGLINNAYDFSYETGFNTPDAKLETITEEVFIRGMESGIFWPFISSQILGKKMIKQKSGSIVNISSMYGVVSPDRRLYEGKEIFNPITYSVAKSAILGMTRYFASFWGEHGIRCNAVSPGPFPNTGGGSYNSNQDMEMIKRLENKTMLGRVGTPADLMGVLVLLLSDASTYITGQNLLVDGGWTGI
jgi:gluconate 5-dehydrogenase